MSYVNQNTNSHESSGDSVIDRLLTCQRLPWESQAEYARFHQFLHQGPSRSVRRAYVEFCRAGGLPVRKDPPSSWYQLYRGQYAAFRLAQRRLRAIERAGEVHGRFPDWERCALIVELWKKRGDHPVYDDPAIQEVVDGLTVIEFAWYSVAVDLDGEPIPGGQTWAEREAIYLAEQAGKC